MGYRFGLKKSLGSWLLNQLSSFPIKNISRAACFKSIRNPWGVQDMDMDSSSLCLGVVEFLPRNSNKSPGLIIFLQLRHAKRLEFLHIWPARTISTNAGFLVIITLFLGGMMEISWAIQPTILTRINHQIVPCPIFWQTQMCFSQIWNTPKIFYWIGSAPYK